MASMPGIMKMIELIRSLPDNVNTMIILLNFFASGTIAGGFAATGSRSG